MTRQDRQTQLADCLKRVDFLSEEEREELYKYSAEEVAMQDHFDYPDCFGSQFGEWFFDMLFIEFGCDEKRTKELIDRHYLAHLLRCKETIEAEAAEWKREQAEWEAEQAKKEFRRRA